MGGGGGTCLVLGSVVGVGAGTPWFAPLVSWAWPLPFDSEIGWFLPESPASENGSPDMLSALFASGEPQRRFVKKPASYSLAASWDATRGPGRGNNAAGVLVSPCASCD